MTEMAPGTGSAPVPPIAPEIAEHVVMTFRAVCETCTWEGRERRNNLTALDDYDRHLLTATHNLSVLQATLAEDEEDPDDAT